MEQIVSWVRDHMHAEADAGYPLLRRIPSTHATACFDYLESISPAERDELLEARARVAALGFVLSLPAEQEILQLMNSNPDLVKYYEAMLRGPLAMGLRYQSIRMAKAVLNDAQSVAMMQQTRSTLGYVPRDDASVPLVNDADVAKLHPAKTPAVEKAGEAAVAGLARRLGREDARRHDEILRRFGRNFGEGTRGLRRSRCTDDLRGIDFPILKAR